MSNKTQLQTNNAQLASLIQTLQGKATGSGTSSIDTCTISITCSSGYIGQFSGTKSEDKSTMASENYTIGESTKTFENIVCNTVFVVIVSGIALVGVTTENVPYVDVGATSNVRVFQAPSEPNSIGTITIYDND